jgi:glycosyltransferase involved in cell wall biosynthesis
MTINSPLVSIGLPVYNGENYLRQATESLLTQDYGNFELIISDNASTDATFIICQEYQATDQRIRLYKNDSNMGAVNNFNKVFRLSSGKYFMWAAHDDLWDKSYISKCVAKLEANPAAVLCISEVLLIDAFGTAWDPNHSGMETVGLDVSERVQMLISRFFWHEMYGIIRSDCLRRTNLLVDKFGPDLILLMELLLLGDFVKIPEKLFMYRRHAAEMSVIDPAKKYGSKACLTAPFTDLARKLLQVVLKSDLENSVKRKIKEEFITCFSFENTIWRELIFQENRSKLPPVIDVQNLPELQNIIRGLILTKDFADEKEHNCD